MRLHRKTRLIPLLVTLLTGCTQPGPLTPAQTLAFPVPQGWTVTPTPTSTPSNTAVQLHDLTGTCQAQFYRSLSTRPVSSAAADMRTAFDKMGHPVTMQPAMSLGGAPATHFSLTIPGNNPPASQVSEQVYLMSAGDFLFTLVTIHAAQCKADFQFILDNFRV